MDELKKQIELILLRETLTTCEEALKKYNDMETSIHYQRIYATANDISQRIAELEEA